MRAFCIQRTVSGLLELAFESTTHDEFFYRWMVSNEMHHGVLEFYRAQGNGRPIRIEFWDAYLVRLKEHFSKVSMPMSLTILPGIIRHNRNTVFRTGWYISNIDEPVAEKAGGQEKPVIERIYWKDSAGKEHTGKLSAADYAGDGVTLYAQTNGMQQGDELEFIIETPDGSEQRMTGMVDGNGTAEMKYQS